VNIYAHQLSNTLNVSSIVTWNSKFSDTN